MKLFKFYISNEIVIINLDGSSELNEMIIDFNFCNNYYSLETYIQ